MNERDSEEVLGMLTALGYDLTERPEEADVILLNTCSVRRHAEERAFGKMGELSVLKDERPDLVLGIIGCMAKLQQEAIFKRLPKVDLIAGPAELYDLPYLLAEIQEKRQRGVTGSSGHGTTNGGAKVMAVGRAFRPLDAKPAGEHRTDRVGAFVTIMEGCDKACTYCIVPRTRGQEISRPADEIIEEVRGLVEAGFQEVTLLGQNVNSYGKRFPDGSGYKGPLGRLRLLEAAAAGQPPEIPGAVGISQTARGTTIVPGLLDFPQLLRLIDRHTNVNRLRFTTSHPFDATDRLFRAMAECDTVCEALHLPVQSGSNRILRSMRRGYTAEAYVKKIKQLKRLVPEIDLSTDIIVGFPGETKADFDATVELMREVQYDQVFIFKYSPRPGTDAAAWEDDVPQPVKEERNQRLLDLHEELLGARYQALVGQEMEILVERRGQLGGQWFGRTRGFHGVIVEHPEVLIGQQVRVRIVRATSHTLLGELDASGHRLDWSNGKRQDEYRG